MLAAHRCFDFFTLLITFTFFSATVKKGNEKLCFCIIYFNFFSYQPWCLCALTYALEHSWLILVLDEPEHFSFIALVSQLLTTPTLSSFVFYLILVFSLRLQIPPYLYVFNLSPIFLNPTELYCVFTNPLLLNSLNLIHPTLINLFLVYIAVDFVIFCCTKFIPAFFRYLHFNLIQSLKLVFLLYCTALFLGGFWAFQVGTWGGWWVWDFSETLLLLFLLPPLIASHLFYSSKRWAWSFCFYLLSFIFYILIVSISNFILGSTLHTFFSDPAKLSFFKQLGTLLFGYCSVAYIIRTFLLIDPHTDQFPRKTRIATELQILTGFLFLIIGTVPKALFVASLLLPTLLILKTPRSYNAIFLFVVHFFVFLVAWAYLYLSVLSLCLNCTFFDLNVNNSLTFYSAPNSELTLLFGDSIGLIENVKTFTSNFFNHCSYLNVSALFSESSSALDIGSLTANIENFF